MKNWIRCRRVRSSAVMFVRGAALCVIALSSVAAAQPQATRFEVSFPTAVERAEITGRLLIAISPRPEPEPRLDLRRTNPVGYRPDGAVQILGRDVEGLAPSRITVVDGSANSYPLDLQQLPAGDYYVQALLVRYTHAHRSDGHVIWVPITDRTINPHRMPGTLFSKPSKVRLAPDAASVVQLSLTEIIPPLPEPQDTAWIRHVRMKSEILSRFWGVPMYLRAHVLVPKGFDERPQARYPAVYLFGHGDPPFGFNPDPASAAADAETAHERNVETGHEFYKKWLADGFPRMVALALELPSPYFVESYAMNSANNGPYGDALTRELIPHLERTFRLIPQRYARVAIGNSTGGWETLAMQLHYPDLLGGAWVINPDPIDFRHYQLVNVYEDANMFTMPLPPFASAERPFRRDLDGQPLFYVRDMARYEAALGSKGRSGAQLDIWQATHGPVGADGYPVPLFDKQTGAIDRQVVNYMREHGYDLTEYARRNWADLGPKLEHRLTFINGEADDFYLNLGVYGFQVMLAQTARAGYPVRFEYGRPRKGHSWRHTNWAGIVGEMAALIQRSAPAGAETMQWRY